MREMNEIESEKSQLDQRCQKAEAQLAQAVQLIDRLRAGTELSEANAKIDQLKEDLLRKEKENDDLLQGMNDLMRERDEIRHQLTGGVEINRARSLPQRFEENQAEMQRLYQRVTELENVLSERDDRIEQLVNEKRDFDSSALELKNRIALYEKGFGISEAMKEVRELKQHNKVQSNEIQQLQTIVNRREKELQRYVAEVSRLRKKYNVSPEEVLVDEEEIELQGLLEIQKLKIHNRQLQSLIDRLNDEKIYLLNELRVGTVTASERGLTYLGLTEDQMRLVNEYAEKLRQGDPTLPVSREVYNAQQQVIKLTNQLDQEKMRYAQLQMNYEELQDKYVKLMEQSRTTQQDAIIRALQDINRNSANQSSSSQNSNDLSSTIQLQSAIIRTIGGSVKFNDQKPIPINDAVRQLLDAIHIQLNSKEKGMLYQRLQQDLKIPMFVVPSGPFNMNISTDVTSDLQLSESDKAMLDDAIKTKLANVINELITKDEKLHQSFKILMQFRSRNRWNQLISLRFLGLF